MFLNVGVINVYFSRNVYVCDYILCMLHKELRDDTVL